MASLSQRSVKPLQKYDGNEWKLVGCKVGKLFINVKHEGQFSGCCWGSREIMEVFILIIENVLE